MDFGIHLDRFDLRVMREWFPFNRLQIFTIAPIVRIELEAGKLVRSLEKFLNHFNLSLKCMMYFAV